MPVGGEQVGIGDQSRVFSHPGGINKFEEVILIRVKISYSYTACRGLYDV